MVISMKIEKNCHNCGAKIHKNDILCLECETPVITVDDITLMPNAETTLQKIESENTEAQEDTQKYDEKPPEEKEQPQSNHNRIAILAILIALLITVLGVGLYFLFNPRDSLQDEPDPAAETAESNETDRTNPTDEPADDLIVNPEPGETPQEVTSLILYRDGRELTEIHIMVGEDVTLHAQILPEGIDTSVTWISSDPDIFDIISYSHNGLEAAINGKFPGVADVVIAAGDFVMTYAVFVDAFPLHVQLENAIDDENEDIWLTLTWTSGLHNGLVTVFERDSETKEWLMDGVYSRSEPDPIFGSTSSSFTLGFADTPRVFYFFADGTGHYRNPDGTDDEDFVWEFMTTFIEPEG